MNGSMVPKFLKEDEENWPKPSPCRNTESEITLTETIKRLGKSTVHFLAVMEMGHGLTGIGKVIDCHRYSSKAKLLRVTTYVLRFKRKRTVDNVSELSADELFEADEM